MRKQIVKKLMFLLLGLACLGLLAFLPGKASATNPQTINFQGKVVNSDGTNVANGTYSFIFRIYDTSSPTLTGTCASNSSCWWEETDSLTVTNGVFQVELGAVCALNSACNSSHSGINFSTNNSLYLTMKFNGDAAGFMSPLVHLNSVPYALQADNAATLGGLSNTNFVQLAQGLQSDSSTTNASIAINKTGSTANILTLQKSSSNVLILDNNGLLTLQPAASLTSGQTAFAQTITNASSTGGTINAYTQTITVSNTSSGSTTNGINISLTDNTALSNTNRGINVSLSGSNLNQKEYGIDISTVGGIGLRAITSGGNPLIQTCADNNNIAVAVCGDSTSAGTDITTGIYGRNTGNTTTINKNAGAGIYGTSTGTTTAGKFIAGVKGVGTNASTAGTVLGVYGNASAGAGATTYGGYFSLDSGSSATAGAALYASNSTVAGNILDLQDNTTSVFTVGDGGLITLQPAANLTSGQAEVAQTFTNGSSTGGTVNGYSQTITVSNTSSASTTNGFNISLTDNTSLANTNQGVNISLQGTNTSQKQIGVDISVNHGYGISVTSNGGNSSTINCGGTSFQHLAICAYDNVSSNAGLGIYSETTSTGNIGTYAGSGIAGVNNTNTGSSQVIAGVKGFTNSAGTAGTAVGVYGQGNNGAGATSYGGYFTIGTNGATLGSALYASNSTVAGNILDLQDNTTSVFTVGDGGLITLQPAANLTSGQAEVAQTFTNGSSTGGTVNGFSQTITVNNTVSAGTTNGINISLTDNTALGNTNDGIKISLAGTNTSQVQYGIDISVNHGVGLRGIVSGTTGSTVCADLSGASFGICGDNTASGTNAGTGIYGRTSSGSSSTIDRIGAGVAGVNTAAGGGSSVFKGLVGTAAQTAAASYTSIGVLGNAQGGAGATTYGGYFTLKSSSATAGSALYASNDTVAANILDLQDNTTSVFTVGDGGLITLQPAANLTSGQAEVAQTFTNGSSTGGTVNGHSQTITVSNTSSASTTNGINISLTDNTSLQNINDGLFITLQGSNANQSQYGVDAGVNAGVGLRGLSTGAGNTGASCGGNATVSVGVCGGSSSTTNGYGGYFYASGSSTGSAIFGSNRTSTSDILRLQDATNATPVTVFKVADGGLITLQPAADAGGNATNLIAGQTHVTQTLTNVSSTGGTVTGYSQTITVNNTSSASTTNGFNISLNDTASSLANVNTGLSITIGSSSTNTSRKEIGINTTVTKGVGIIGISSGGASSSVSCGQSNFSGIAVGICGTSTSTVSGIGVFGQNVTSGGDLANVGSNFDAGVIGYNSSSSTGSNNILGLRGSVNASGATGTYKAVAIAGIAKAASSSATTYGGYFTLDSGSSATAGAALYASNSSIAANILQLQDNTTDVMTVADEGATTFQNSSNSTNAFKIRNTNSQSLLALDTQNSTDTSTTNLANNPSVETAPSASDWVLKGTATIAQDSTASYFGANSLKITGAATNDGAFGKLNTTLSASTNYNIIFYVKSNSPANTATIQAGYSINASAESVLCTNTLVVTYSGWYKYNCTIQTPSSGETSSNAIFIKTTDAAARTINVDAAVVQQSTATSAPTYDEGNMNIQAAITSSLLLQNSSNSTQALSVHNSGGATIFKVDTTSGNLVSNPSFEVSLAGGAGSGWTAFNGTASPTLSRDTTQSYAGSSSMKVVVGTNGTGGAQLALNPVVTNASTAYTVSFFALLSSGTAPTFQATYDPNGSNPLTCSPSGTIVTTGWIRLSCTFGTNAITPSTSGFLRIAQTNSNTSTWFIDGVQLEAASAASNYADGNLTLNGVITSPITFKGPSAITAFQIQNSSSQNVLGVNTLNGQVLLGNAGTLGGILVFNNASGTNTVSLASGATSSSYTITLPSAVSGGAAYCLTSNTGGTTSWTACGAASTATITLTPEYAGAVMTGSGGSNTGTMTSDFCSGSGVGGLNINASICGTVSASHNYYSWTANATNNYDIWVRWQAPSDFASFGSNAFTLNGWTSSASDSVALTVYNSSNTSCGTTTISTSSTAFTTSSLTPSGCTVSAGDVLSFKIHLNVGVNGEFARAGEITIVYSRN